MKKKKHLFLIGMFIPIFFIFLLVIVAGGTSSSADSFSSSAGSLNITSKDLASKANISEEKAQNVIDIANYLMSKERFSIQGASGALAVAERESGFDPKAENIGGGVAGIFQWSGWSNNVNGNRWSKAENRTLSMDVELKLMSAELNGAYKRTKDLVSVSTDPRQASLDWSQYYEGVALSDGQTKADKLQDDAQKWYDLLKDHVGFSNDSSGEAVNGVMGPEGREPLPDKAGESTLLSRSGGEKGLRGGGAAKPQCSSRGRPGFRGTLWVASRVPRALSTSNS